MRYRHVFGEHGRPDTFFVGQEEVAREEYERLMAQERESLPQAGAGTLGASFQGWKPLHSEAAAVHPEQIPEAIESARAKGVPTNFDELGRPIFTSRSHRRAYLKAYGWRDNDGGYGDG